MFMNQAKKHSKYYVNHFDSKVGIWVIDLFPTKKKALECKKKYSCATIQTL